MEGQATDKGLDIKSVTPGGHLKLYLGEEFWEIHSYLICGVRKVFTC